MKLSRVLFLACLGFVPIASSAPIPDPRGGGLGDLVEGVANIVTRIVNTIRQDKENRNQFTKQLVTKLHAANPRRNYVVVHVKHKFQFAGVEGNDWKRETLKFDPKLGKDIKYTLYTFKAGEFWLQGDGGYLNWAFFGTVTKKENPGPHLVFGDPS